MRVLARACGSVFVRLCVCVCVTVVAVAVAVAAAVACVFVAVVYGKQLELWWMAPRGVQKSASNSPGIPRELPSGEPHIRRL